MGWLTIIIPIFDTALDFAIKILLIILLYRLIVLCGEKKKRNQDADES